MFNAKQGTEIAALLEKHENEIHKYKRSRENDFHNIDRSSVISSKAIPLIDLMSALPVMPSPWSSSDQGEGWTWGDFIIYFLKEPKELMNGSPHSGPIAIKYFYSMVVFYHPEHNPHYPSKCPILAVNLEQAVDSLCSSKVDNPLFLGMFDQGGLRHINYGEYKGSAEAEVVKSYLFKIISERLDLTGLPQRIGTLRDAIQLFENSLEAALNRKVGKEGVSPDETAQSETLLYFKQRYEKLMRGELSKEEAAKFDNEMVAIMRGAEFPPIENIFIFPSMAAPFSSINKGEVWLWDDYFCVLQKKPKTVFEAFTSYYPSNFDSKMTMTYHYAMTVIYIHTPSESVAPTLSIGIEQVISNDYKGEIFLGMFEHNSHTNLGEYHYDESVPVDRVRSKFMQLMKDKLRLDGEPKLIGTIPDIFSQAYAIVNRKQ